MKRPKYITNLESLIDAFYNLTIDFHMEPRDAVYQLSLRTSRKLIAIMIQKLQIKI